jgi:hypothetical protein
VKKGEGGFRKSFFTHEKVPVPFSPPVYNDSIGQKETNVLEFSV